MLDCYQFKTKKNFKIKAVFYHLTYTHNKSKKFNHKKNLCFLNFKYTKFLFKNIKILYVKFFKNTNLILKHKT